MKKNLISAGILAVALTAACSHLSQNNHSTPQQTPPPATYTQVLFPKPDRIRYDDKSLIIDNKPVFIYSGAFHYFRCPPELWKDRFSRMKEAGLNCVETYLAWNYHEPDEPSSPEDFSKLVHMEELNAFISMARNMGFYIIIRPGPYICAEWDRGGLPEWLLNHKPANFRAEGGGYLRSSDPAVMRWNQHWYDAAAKLVKPHLVTNLPPGTPGVIAWQLENEYNLTDIPIPEQAAVLEAFAQWSIADGIDVPLFTCRTRSGNATPWLQSHVFDMMTCYPRYDMNILLDRIRNTAEPQPGKFRAVAELQAGWFSEVNGKLSEEMGFNAAHLNQIAIICLEQGFTLINWYMFYGGSQFGYGAAQNMTQSYDYDAPIRESGGIGPRYLAAKALGLMLKDHGTRLVHSSPLPLKVTGTTTKDLSIGARQSEDGTRYFFVRTDSRDEARKGTAQLEANGKNETLTYDLPPFGAKILCVPPGAPIARGEWLPKPAEAPARPTNLPDLTINVMPSGIAPDEFINWHPVKMGQSFASMAINDSRPVAFRSTFTLTEAQAKNPPTLFAHTPGVTLVFSINGQLVPPETTAAGLVPLAGKVKPGENQVELLLENPGNHNHIALDTFKTAPQLTLLPANACRPLADWRMKPMTGIVNVMGLQLDVAKDLNVLDWPRVSVTAGPTLLAENATGIYHTPLDVTADQLAAGVTLVLGALDETGDVFVNGRRIGGNATERCQPFAADITPRLNVGRNAIAVVVANKDHSGGLYGGAFAVPRGKSLPTLEMSKETRGTTQKYSDANPTSAHWSSFQPTAAPAGLMTWYRTEFTMPPQPAGIWVPYHLHLEANLTGQIYLNGHHLGTYWAPGPQRDIWLPECWLNMTGKNAITLQARPTTTATPLFKSAEIRPYKDFAETRSNSHP